MKNDFREFYDEDYVMHSMTEEEYIAHANGWGHKFIDKIRTKLGKWRYIYDDSAKKDMDAHDRVRNAEKRLNSDIDKNAYTYGYEALQRDTRARYQNQANRRAELNKNSRDYTYGYEQLQRDARAKYQGEANRRLAKKGTNAMAGDSRYKSNPSNVYRQQQAKGNAGTKAYNERKEREARQLSAAKANKMYYDKGAQAKAKSAAAKKREDQYDFYLTQYGHGPKKYKKYTGPLWKKMKKK